MIHYHVDFLKVENEWTLGQALYFLRRIGKRYSKNAARKRDKSEPMTESELLSSPWMKG